MIMNDQNPLNKKILSGDLELHKLSLEHIRRIDEMLDEIGEYGEIHLIVQRGELRYINKVESYRLWDKEDNG